MKTTTPNRYVVKPHKGVIDANGEVNIAITLLPFNYKEENTYKDKFLIQVKAYRRGRVVRASDLFPSGRQLWGFESHSRRSLVKDILSYATTDASQL